MENQSPPLLCDDCKMPHTADENLKPTFLNSGSATYILLLCDECATDAP